MKKIVLAGGSWFLGNQITEIYRSMGVEVVNLSRNPKGEHEIAWDGKTQGEWAKEIDGADVVINLSGKSVDCRYNAENKKLILTSRTDSTKAVGDAIKACANPPKLWINASSATIYRDSYDKQMEETSDEIGEGFSEGICKQWEAAFFGHEVAIRKVSLRITIVLGRGEGAMIPLTNLARLGLGGHQGTGKQMFSWVHIDDFLGMMQLIISNENISGPVNVSSPGPVTNSAFMRAMRKGVGMPIGLPAPKFLLEIGAFFLRTETELMLKSRFISPCKMLDNGYEFKYPEVQAAVVDLLKKKFVDL